MKTCQSAIVMTNCRITSSVLRDRITKTLAVRFRITIVVGREELVGLAELGERNVV